jgi:DNA-binding transcriptional ArsR family regulator
MSVQDVMAAERMPKPMVVSLLKAGLDYYNEIREDFAKNRQEDATMSLSDSAHDVYEFICEHTMLHNAVEPTITQIARAMDKTASTICHHVAKLKKAGLLPINNGS